MRCVHGERGAALAPRGIAALALLAVLALISLTIVGMVLCGARDQDLGVSRMGTLRATYAAESGIEMAMREVVSNADADGDGGIGSVSNDANSANDPTFGSATAYVTSSTAGGQTTLTSIGTCGSCRRKMTTVVTAGSGGQLGYTTALSSSQSGVNAKQVATRVTLTGTQSITSITAYVHGSTTRLLSYAVYGDSSGEPGALLAQSYTEAIGSDSFHWHTLYVPTTTLSAGTYWLALAFEHSSECYAYTSTGGQTRWNSNNAITGGFNNPWGASSTSNTQQVSIYANGMSQAVGPLTFASSADYDNTALQTQGLFRDLSSATLIEQGSDISSNATHYNALNFTRPSGLVSNCLTVYDTTPGSASQSNTTGAIRLSADVLITGFNNARWIGLVALANETSGQDGIALALRDNGNSDRLELFRVPSSGDISSATALAQTSTFNAISASNWYRLVMDIDIVSGTLSVEGRVYSHTTASNPNSGLNPTPLKTFSYSAAMSSLTGLQSSGEVGLMFDTGDTVTRGSVTNFRIDSGVASSSASTVSSWTAVEP